MKKKILSLILVMVLLLTPFSILLNVKAVAITTDSNITNGEGYKVTNVSADGVHVSLNSAEGNDQFAMWKILDVYYDSSSNQMSYGFTSNFNSFANSQIPTISINDYFTAQSDLDHNNYYNDSSDFNALISKYAMYIRTNNVNYNYQMTNVYDSEHNNYNAIKTNVEAGVYLILPTTSSATHNIDDGFDIIQTMSYSVLIANVTPSVTNGEWVFNQVNINPKAIHSTGVNIMIDDETSNAINIFNGSANFGTILNYDASKNYSYFVFLQPTDVPTNAHESIVTAHNNDIFDMVDIEYPNSLTPDLTDVYYFEGDIYASKIENGGYYITLENDEQDNPIYEKLADLSTSNNKLSFDYYSIDENIFSIVFNLNVDDSSLSSNSTITTTSYTVKDPYVDIGTVTRSDIRNAFNTSDANYNSTKSVNIRKAIEKVESTVSLNVSGLNITNKNSDNENLSGAEFAVYAAYDPTNGTYSNKIGDNIVISNGAATFYGIDPAETYFLKQVKAASGYKVYDDKVIVLKGTNDSTSYDANDYQVETMTNGFYNVNVVSNSIGTLPFTGGIGTILYSLIGLLIVIGGIGLIRDYKRKKPIIQ